METPVEVKVHFLQENGILHGYKGTFSLNAKASQEYIICVCIAAQCTNNLYLLSVNAITLKISRKSNITNYTPEPRFSELFFTLEK